MNAYQVYSPAMPNLPREILNAETSFAARKDYAARHGIANYECIARRIEQDNDPLDDFNYVGSRHHY